MFVHHVFFWMQDSATEAEKAQLRAGIESLSAVQGITTFHVGVPAPTNREVIDSSYSFSLLTIFMDAAAEAVYQTHPIHLKFIADCKHLWSRVVVYDSF
jgi:Stress responsive A/B Barrel Domain